MAIETYISNDTVESLPKYKAAVQDVLTQAGFTDCTVTMTNGQIYLSGKIFDHNLPTTFSNYFFLEGAPSRNGADKADLLYKIVALVDKERKILYLGGQNVMSTGFPSEHDAGCLFITIFDGDHFLRHTHKNATGSENKIINDYYNVPQGHVNGLQENALAPLWCNLNDGWSGTVAGDWESYQTHFYVSLTCKAETCGTVVSDGTNTFTSCGNMMYIKNAS